MTTRNSYFDNLKGFLILCVIIGNSLEFADPTNISVHFFILILYLFHMPLFMFISGYFFKRSSRTPAQIISKTLVLYTFFQIFYIYFGHFLYDTSETKIELFYPQWTLWYLLTLTCLYAIISYINNYKTALLISLIISLLIGYDTSVGTHISLSRTFFFMPFFLLGCLYKEEYLEKIKKYLKIILPLAIICLIILYLIRNHISVDVFFEYTYYEYHFDKPKFSLMLRIFHYISALLIGLILLCITTKNKTILSYIGKNSLILYLAHSGTIQLLSKKSMLNYSTFFNMIKSEIIIVISTIIISTIYVYIRKFVVISYKTIKSK